MNSREQFGRVATNYTASPRHMVGAEDVVNAIDPAASAVAVDIGTGTGHTAHALARRCRYVMATDITPEMLAETSRLAADYGLDNIQTLYALAESLPYADASVDVVTCRLAAHHFNDVQAFCREIRRIVKPDGRVVVYDIISPEEEEVAAFENEIEVLRDPSHIYDLKVSTWTEYLEAAGFEILHVHTEHDPMDHELYDWTKRSGTPADVVEVIKKRLGEASPESIEILGLKRDGETYRWGWPAALFLLKAR